METEQAQKSAIIEEQQRRIRQRKEQKVQQEHDQDISNASFQASPLKVFFAKSLH